MALLFLIRFQQSEAFLRFHRCHMSLDWSHGNLRDGLRRFHSGAFFEAHEHWESVWVTAQDPEKTFLQALIQVAASFHHFYRGNRLGTISLLRSALRRLDTYPDAFAGGAMLTGARKWSQGDCRGRNGGRRLRPESVPAGKSFPGPAL